MSNETVQWFLLIFLAAWQVRLGVRIERIRRDTARDSWIR